MNESDILSWLVVTIIPVAMTIASFVWKFGKDKRNHENRITRIESNVKDHDKTLTEVKSEQRDMRDDLKVLYSLEKQNQMILDMVKKLQDQFENYTK